MISYAENLLSSASFGVFLTGLAAHQEQRCTQLLNFGDHVLSTNCGQMLVLEQHRLLVDLVTQLARQTKEVEEPS